MTSEQWVRVQSVFERALDQPAAERRAWVASTCGQDRDLAALVQRLLDADAADRGELDGAVASALTAITTPLTAQRLGPYRVLAEIGRGGMGTVYLAERDDQAFEQRVAIKVVRGLLDDDRVRRFRAERQILATLNHPNIARLLDGGTTGDGWPYLVMEYVAGEPIDRYAHERQLSIRGRLELFITICRAVGHAHRHLVVHRDLKPGNILVTSDGVPKLLDFGIAKLLDADETAASMTLTGMRLLTPDYASPEQVRGESITTATDVYALGVLLFELLTGRRPFSMAGRGARDIERLVCDTEPPRPGTLAPLDPDLDVIALTALQKDAARRYASAETMADDVRRHLDGMPIEARPSTWRYRATRFVSRHRWGVTAAATLALVVIGFAAVVSIQAARIAAERDAAARERDTAAAVSDFLVELFEVSDPSEARGNSVTARELLDRGASRIDTELKGEPAVQSRLMDTIGRVYRSLGLFDRAGAVLTRALEVRERANGRPSAEVATTLAELGENARALGRLADSERLHREALDMRRAVFPADAPEIAFSLNSLGLSLNSQGRYQEAEGLFRQAIEVWRRTLPPGDPQVAVALNNLAILQRQTSRFAEAEQSAREALAIRQRSLQPPHELIANSLMQLGQVLNLLGRLDEAEPLMREALAMRLTLHDREHPSVAVSYNNLAALLHDAGHLADAEPMYREAVALTKVRFGTAHPEYGVSLNNLATLLEDRGAYAEAEKLFREALAIRQKALGPEHPAVARGMNNLGRVLALQGQTAEAASLVERSLAMRRKLLGERHVDVANGTGTLALVRVNQLQLAEAERLYTQQVDQLRAILPQDHPSIGTALTALATVMRDRGRAADAEPLLRSALDIREQRLPPGHWQIGLTACTLASTLQAPEDEDEKARLLQKGRSLLTSTLGESDSRVKQCAGF